jgi:hypothetical protein
MTQSLDHEMVRLREDDHWRTTGVGARGPSPQFRAQLGLLGQFVGDWELFPPRRSRPRRRLTANAHAPVGAPPTPRGRPDLAAGQIWGHSKLGPATEENLD